MSLEVWKKILPCRGQCWAEQALHPGDQIDVCETARRGGGRETEKKSDKRGEGGRGREREGGGRKRKREGGGRKRATETMSANCES